MSEKISTIILSNSERTYKIIENYLNEFVQFENVPNINDLSEIFNFLSSLSKSLLIVDVSDNFDKYIDFISSLAKAAPNCKIVAFSDAPSVNTIVKLMRAGAKDFLALPIIKTEFIDVLEKISNQFWGCHIENKCRVITVFSNKGGIGKTSIASNLALELAKITKENVALVDLNFQLGDITSFLDLQPSFNISYMLQNLDKINSDFMLNTVEKYKDTSLYVLADPPYFKQAENIPKAQIALLFEKLKETFSYVVVDTDSTFDSKTVTALDNSDLIFLITNSDSN